MIVWIVALRPEAAPLVSALGLHGHPRGTPWPLYVSGDGAAALVVSGVGRVAAAAACGWAQGFLDAPSSAGWINAGVAGHSEGPIGRVVTAHRVVEAAGGRSWYPPPVAGCLLDSDTVWTVDEAETAFERPGAYDMEASGFLAATSRCVSAELAQVVKVVSDTPEAPATDLTAEKVESLVASRANEILELGEAVRRLGEQVGERLEEPSGMAAFRARWRFSVSQERELRRLLRRRAALAPGRAPELPEAVDGRAALKALSRSVRRLAVRGR